MSPADAEKLIFQALPAASPVVLPLGSCWGSELREPVLLDRDLPACDQVLVDGIAIAQSALSAGATRFRLQGVQAAGTPPMRLAAADQCIEVTTGAVLPDGCDCVIPLESIGIDGETVSISPLWTPVPNAHIQRAGAEAVAGATLLSPGLILRGPEIALAATAGRTELAVGRLPRVRSLSVGTELVNIGDPVEAWQVRRASMAAVSAAFRRYGIAELGSDHVDDDAARLREALLSCLNDADLVVVCGGTGKGARDFAVSVLAEVGARVVVKGVAQRPGGSMWFALGPHGQLMFGLPGGLAATLVCLARYVIPAVFRFAGRTRPYPGSVTLTGNLVPNDRAVRFAAVRLLESSGGTVRAEVSRHRGLGDSLPLIGTDGIVELGAGKEALADGASVSFYGW